MFFSTLGRQVLLPLAVAALLASYPVHALEHLTVVRERGGREEKLSGEAIIEARDGGMLLKTPDGTIHQLPAELIRSRKSDDAKLVMLTRDELTDKLLKELPPGFQVHQSKNYIVCYNTTSTYAKWTSSLLERLQRAFIDYWKKRGCEVDAPEQPLPVVVFGDQTSYAAYAKKELGAAVANVIGYYSIESNRITMYDLTGMQAIRTQATNRGSRSDISELLSLPAAEPLVATIIHEATHQISFNCGLQTRMVDNPLWLSEGLAVYFETPDLNSSRNWSGVGNVNYTRFDRFRDNYDAGKVATLPQLVGDDDIFRNPETAVDAYAQAWAWNYFLIKWHPKEYAAYLKTIAARPLFNNDDKKQRVAAFQKHFGADLEKLEDEFYRRIAQLR